MAFLGTGLFAFGLCPGLLLLPKMKIRREFPRVFCGGLLGAMTAAIFSNQFFALAPDVYGISNLIGHLLELLSSGFIYGALIVVGTATPFNLLFCAPAPGKIN